ncbi:HNH endonuclease signature motif containing protein [Trinickia mobilis]|uniref:HNH endonuclease signature motif containing protein n=1 Tax=Trinickia mobilis TaxID=2816356 RepID=UPI001A8C9FA9|nr:HNH endonuclease signature motif containing protein [Trinickia mobilis]
MTKRKPGSTTPPRVLWPPEQVAELRLRYPDEKTEVIAESFGVSVSRVYSKAAKLGLSKSEAFFASPGSGRMDGVRGASSRFVKGQTPVNKGIKRPGTGSRTSFKPGQRPPNWMPIGSLRDSQGGYLQVKVSETNNQLKDWVFLHKKLWEDAHGPIPKGHVVVLRDGDKKNVVLENLELITKRELMARNTVHNLPSELKEVIRLKGVLSRKINGHDRGASDSPVRNVGSAERQGKADGD